MTSEFVIETLGVRFRMEILDKDPSMADHARYMQIKERWSAAVLQVVQPWTEPWAETGPRLIYTAPTGQVPLEAPSANGPFRNK